MLGGPSRRHSEVYIHSEIFKARPDVHSVIHTHPPYAVALSASGRPLKCYSQPSALSLKRLRLYRYQRTHSHPGHGKGGRGRARPTRAVLLKNHGVTVVGASIERRDHVIMLESAAMVQMIHRSRRPPGADSRALTLRSSGRKFPT